MSNKACLLTLKKIKRQWIQSSLSGLSAYDDGTVAVLTGHQVLPVVGKKASFSAVASGGMTRRSLNLVFVASLPVMPAQSDGLYAFLLQASAVMAPFEFLVDFKSGHLLIRQSMIASPKSTVPGKSFVDSVDWFAPRVFRAVKQIEQQMLSVADARQMADFLSQAYFEVLAG